MSVTTLTYTEVLRMASLHHHLFFFSFSLLLLLLTYDDEVDHHHHHYHHHHHHWHHDDPTDSELTAVSWGACWSCWWLKKERKRHTHWVMATVIVREMRAWHNNNNNNKKKRQRDRETERSLNSGIWTLPDKVSVQCRWQFGKIWFLIGGRDMSTIGSQPFFREYGHLLADNFAVGIV